MLLVVFSSIAIGAFVTTLLPGMDADRLGANHWRAYLFALSTVLVPNALLIGAIFFAVAAATSKMLPVYVGSILILLGWLISSQFGRDVEYRAIAALADPFGVRAMSSLTEYWTISERNTRIVPLAGVLLWNRLLWLGIAVLVSAFCFWRFSFSEVANALSKKRAKLGIEPAVVQDSEIRTIGAPARSDRSAPPPSPWRLVPHRAWLEEFAGTTKNVCCAHARRAPLPRPWPARPWAAALAHLGHGRSPSRCSAWWRALAAFMLIHRITFYAGELVWR